MKIKLNTKDMKFMEIKFSRDLFGQLLLLEVDQAIRMEVMLTFPLTPAPLSLAHINAEMCVPNNATLVHKLEKNPFASITDEDNPDVVIVDFIFVLTNIMQNLSSTYSEITKYIVIIEKTTWEVLKLPSVMSSDEKPGIKDTTCDIQGSVETGSTHVYTISRL